MGMTCRPDPRSELFLSAAQVRATTPCPLCGALAGTRCLAWRDGDFRFVPTVHAPRYALARALQAARRLTPTP
jgi:hypothetical protein